MVLSNGFFYERIQLDTINERFNKVPTAKEGDANGRGMIVVLTENGLVKNTTGVSLLFKWEHTRIAGAQGLEDFEPLDLTKGEYIVTYPAEMNHEGYVKAEIRIIDNGKYAGSRNMKIQVEPSVGDDTAMESSNQFSALVTALLQVNSWNTTIDGKIVDWEADMAATKQLYIDNMEEVEATYPQELLSISQQLEQTKNINNIVLLPNKKYPKILSEVSCNSLTGWTPVDGTTELSTIIDEINDHTIIDAVKFISTANGRVTKSLSTAIDGAVNPIMVQVYLEESENIDNMMTTVLEFYSDGNFTSGYRAETYIQYAEGNNQWTKDFARKGLFYLCQFPAEILRTKGVNFNVNNITGIGFHVYHPAATTRSIKIAKVAFVVPLQVGGCITIVDNFDVNVPAMCDYAYSKGVKLNVSVIPNSIKGGNAIISASKAELDRIKAQGHTIINHTYNHLTFNDLTNVGITDEIVKSENWMEKNNYTKGSRILSIPSARFNMESYRATINTNVQGIYHNWTFTNSGGTNLNKIMCPYYPTTRFIDTSSLDKLDEAITLCNKAVQYKGIVVNGYHGTFWSKDNGVSWKAYIDDISQIQGLKHYGIDEILEGKFV